MVVNAPEVLDTNSVSSSHLQQPSFFDTRHLTYETIQCVWYSPYQIDLTRGRQLSKRLRSACYVWSSAQKCLPPTYPSWSSHKSSDGMPSGTVIIKEATELSPARPVRSRLKVSWNFVLVPASPAYKFGYTGIRPYCKGLGQDIVANGLSSFHGTLLDIFLSSYFYPPSPTTSQGLFSCSVRGEVEDKLFFLTWPFLLSLSSVLLAQITLFSVDIHITFFAVDVLEF